MKRSFFTSHLFLPSYGAIPLRYASEVEQKGALPNAFRVVADLALKSGMYGKVEKAYLSIYYPGERWETIVKSDGRKLTLSLTGPTAQMTGCVPFVNILLSSRSPGERGCLRKVVQVTGVATFEWILPCIATEIVQVTIPSPTDRTNL